MLFHDEKGSRTENENEEENCDRRDQVYFFAEIECKHILYLRNEQVSKKLNITLQKHHDESRPQCERSEEYRDFEVEQKEENQAKKQVNCQN
jgi:hypothetical protein